MILLGGLLFVLASCGGGASCEGEGVAMDKLKGTWKVTDAEGTLAEEQIGTTYTFMDDKAKSVSPSGAVETDFSQKLDGPTLTLNPTDADVEYVYCLSMDGEQLVMNQTVLESKLVLEKQ